MQVRLAPGAESTVRPPRTASFLEAEGRPHCRLLPPGITEKSRLLIFSDVNDVVDTSLAAVAPSRQCHPNHTDVPCALQATGRRDFGLQDRKPHTRAGLVSPFKHLNWPMS